jgi:predicted O-methyltransferase YrrM
MRRFLDRFLKPRPAVSAPPTLPVLPSLERGDVTAFRQTFEATLAACTWQTHPRYSVFTQYDQSFYRAHQAAFEHKYRCFYAVARTIGPQTILELGTHAGSGADAYLAGAPQARYIGYDLFGEGVREDDGSAWHPRQIAELLFADRGYSNYELIQVDLRTLSELPQQADFVVVDGAHDFDNEYADLLLSLTAQPQWIFVDDTEGPEAHSAVEKFMRDDIADRMEWAYPVSYAGGGLVIKLL